MRFFRKGAFRGYFFSYLYILLFMLGLTLLYNVIFISQVQKNIRQYTIDMIGKTVNALDERFSKIKTIAGNAAYDEFILDLISRDDLNERVNRVLMDSLSEQLNHYVSYFGFIEQIILFLPRSDIIVTNLTVYDPADFLQIRLNSHEISLGAMNKWFMDYHLHDFTGMEFNPDYTQLENSLFHLLSIPYLPVYEEEATLGIILNKKILTDLFAGGSPIREGIFSIIDDKKRLVFSVGKEDGSALLERFLETHDWDVSSGVFIRKFEGEKYLTYYQKSDTTKLSFGALIPMQVFLDDSVFFRRALSFFLVAALFLGVLISLILANAKAKPIERLISLFSQSKKYQSQRISKDILFLEKATREVLEENNIARHTLEEYVALIRSGLLNRLLLGGLRGINRDLYQELGFSPEFSSFYVFLISPKRRMEEGERNIDHIVIAEVVRKIIHASSEAVALGFNETDIAVIIGVNREYLIDENINVHQRERILSLREALRANIVIRGKENIRFGVGSVVDGWSQIHVSFDEAKLALEYADFGEEDGIVFFTDFNAAATQIYWPKPIERSLYDTLLDGDREKTERILKGVFRRNFSLNRIPPKMAASLLFLLSFTLLKWLENWKIDVFDVFGENNDLVGRISRLSQLSEQRRSVLEFYKVAADYLKRKRDEENSLKKERIALFIQRNYGNPNLDLVMTADFFGYSSNYFSTFFRSCFGRPFREYLTGKRIDEAARLLKTSNLKAKEVMYRVGYTHEMTFFRNFKKITGFTPNEFRSQYNLKLT